MREIHGFRCDGMTDESGNVTMMFLAFAMAFMLLLVAVIDFGTAYTQHNIQKDKLAIACDNSSKTTSRGFLVKNSEWPEQEVAKEVISNLRANGCNEAVKVWVREADAGEVGATDSRALGVYVEVIGKFTPITGGSVVGELDITSTDGFYLVPYSSHTIWRPAKSRPGCYKSDSGSSNITYEEGGVPEQVNEQVRAAIRYIATADNE